VFDTVIAEPRWHDANVFVASDAEGPMIAEFAMWYPRRPARRLIRPGKVLATDNWFGCNYKSRYSSPAEVESLLADLHVRVVILRAKPVRMEKPHEILLRQTVTETPDVWRKTLITASPPDYEVFERVTSDGS